MMVIDKGLIEIFKDHKDIIEDIYGDLRYNDGMVVYDEIQDTAIDDFFNEPDHYLKCLDELGVNTKAYF